MIFDNGHITPEALAELSRHTDLIECECPAHLMAILAKVREFHDYTTECITKYPKDAATHIWLQTAAKNIDAMLSNTIVQLARMEGFVSEENEFVSRKNLSE
nr:hypothetical protein CKG001_02890 [Bdellovibrio sp. CKG001]